MLGVLGESRYFPAICDGWDSCSVGSLASDLDESSHIKINSWSQSKLEYSLSINQIVAHLERVDSNRTSN